MLGVGVGLYGEGEGGWTAIREYGREGVRAEGREYGREGVGRVPLCPPPPTFFFLTGCFFLGVFFAPLGVRNRFVAWFSRDNRCHAKKVPRTCCHAKTSENRQA